MQAQNPRHRLHGQDGHTRRAATSGTGLSRPGEQGAVHRRTPGGVVMSSFKEKYGPWALVTGASSGLGSSFAKQLAVEGLNLVLVARREDRLRVLARELERTASIETQVIVADL